MVRPGPGRGAWRSLSGYDWGVRTEAAAVTTHYGRYEDLAAGHGAVMRWLRDNGQSAQGTGVLQRLGPGAGPDVMAYRRGGSVRHRLMGLESVRRLRGGHAWLRYTVATGR